MGGVRSMGELDIGLAMVSARIASSDMEREQEIQKRRQKGLAGRGQGRNLARRMPSLPGAKLEVISGQLVLIPSAESPRHERTRGWTMTRKDGSVVRIDTGEVVKPLENK